MREIVEDIFTWPWFSEPHGYNFNGYLLAHESGNLCIDPVEPTEEVVQELTELGVSRILLTNRNHSRAANRVRNHTNARTAIHPADAGHARGQGTEIDEELQIAEKIGPLVVVAVAGKSPGEVALHWPERRILIVGDAVIGNPPGSCSILPKKVMDDPRLLMESIERLLSLDFDTLLPGDGTAILRDAKDRLNELVVSFRK
jgi:glyoxylase-like metal-dependent hydrolase (beta-lactamase superfamily II)